MPRYYCDYCDTYLTHDSPSVRKQHNAGYKHKANIRSYYQKFEEQQTQILIDQKIKEHLGQTVVYQQIGAAYNQHLAAFPGARPRLPVMPPPMFPGPPQMVPGIRPPMLPIPVPGAPGYGNSPMAPMQPPPAPSLPPQTGGLPPPPSTSTPSPELLRLLQLPVDILIHNTPKPVISLPAIARLLKNEQSVLPARSVVFQASSGIFESILHW
ncbi:U1 small nuclear ribonucleoprotein C-like [Salvia divinorum]|uniref:U1 small nuclear ribonucleoprotein C n=1 Tax=Salvia divinorum TaxID=28513 RepID=A0ABD1G4M7_SALDI